MQVKCTTINQLKLLMKHKRIICWGIGNYFRAFVDSCLLNTETYSLAYLIDNAPNMQDTCREINGQLIHIISFEEYLKRKCDDDLIIITTVHYKDIISQIKACSSEILFIPYALVQHERNIGNCILRREDTIQIPAKIHYCWFGHGKIPEKDREYIEGWKQFCPQYEIICWNEDKFDITHNEYLKYAYSKKKWAFVADYVRMYALYHEGGIYLDTDVELLKNLDDLRYQYAYMGMEESGCVNSGVGMGTVAGNLVIGEILQLYDSITQKDIESWTKWKVNAEWESGILRKHGFLANNQFQIVDNIAIYPSEFFSPVLVGQKNVEVSDHTFSIHHYHYSWLDEKQRNTIWGNKGEEK